MSRELTTGEIRKRKKGLCITKGCRKKSKRRYCSACARRSWAESNPGKYVFANLRGNAKRRGKEFSLTWEEFESFLKRENYLDKPRGREKFSVSVDREFNEFGYHAWNIKSISIQENSMKRSYVDYFREKEPDCPF